MNEVARSGRLDVVRSGAAVYRACRDVASIGVFAVLVVVGLLLVGLLVLVDIADSVIVNRRSWSW